MYLIKKKKIKERFLKMYSNCKDKNSLNKVHSVPEKYIHRIWTQKKC